MPSESSVKRLYDRFGEAYQLSRDRRERSRLYNEYLELPCMLRAVGEVKGRRLLDVGCGAGVHVARYARKGARVCGVDVSESMLAMARERCKDASFQLASVRKLPFPERRFDLVTASLVLDYVRDLRGALAEMARVAKRGARLFYSYESIYVDACENTTLDATSAYVLGYLRTAEGKLGFADIPRRPRVVEWEMLPGMRMRTYKRTLQHHVRAIVGAGLALVDVIDCFPTSGFHKRDPINYACFSKLPIFEIFVCEKR